MRTTPKVLTDDEVRRLLAATSRSERDLRDHVLLTLALTTGLRVSELVALDVADVKNGKGVKRRISRGRPFPRRTSSHNRPWRPFSEPFPFTLEAPTKLSDQRHPIQ